METMAIAGLYVVMGTAILAGVVLVWHMIRAGALRLPGKPATVGTGPCAGAAGEVSSAR